MKGRLLAPMAIVLAVAAALFYVRTRFLLVELSLDVGKENATRARLEQETRALTLELATLKSPARIEQIARTKLHLTRMESFVPVVHIARDSPP